MLQNETLLITKSNILAALLSKIIIPNEPILHKLKVPYLLAYSIDTRSGEMLEIVLETASQPTLALRSSRYVKAGEKSIPVKSALARVKLSLPSDALGYKLALLDGIVTLIRDLPHPLMEEGMALLREQVAEDIAIEDREAREEEGYYE